MWRVSAYYYLTKGVNHLSIQCLLGVGVQVRFGLFHCQNRRKRNFFPSVTFSHQVGKRLDSQHRRPAARTHSMILHGEGIFIRFSKVHAESFGKVSYLLRERSQFGLTRAFERTVQTVQMLSQPSQVLAFFHGFLIDFGDHFLKASDIGFIVPDAGQYLAYERCLVSQLLMNIPLRVYRHKRQRFISTVYPIYPPRVLRRPR